MIITTFKRDNDLYNLTGPVLVQASTMQHVQLLLRHAVPGVAQEQPADRSAWSS
jgi:hypothetical protein